MERHGPREALLHFPGVNMAISGYFDGGSRCHPAQLTLLFNMIPSIFYESVRIICTHFRAIEALQLDLSQIESYFEVPIRNSY